jgi:hypothetical protein
LKGTGFSPYVNNPINDRLKSVCVNSISELSPAGTAELSPGR